MNIQEFLKNHKIERPETINNLDKLHEYQNVLLREIDNVTELAEQGDKDSIELLTYLAIVAEDFIKRHNDLKNENQ